MSLDQLGDLVVLAPVRALPAPPLLAVDRAEVAPLFGERRVVEDAPLERGLVDLLAALLAVAGERPVGPDADALGDELADIGPAGQEPEHLLGGELPIDALGGEQRHARRRDRSAAPRRTGCGCRFRCGRCARRRCRAGGAADRDTGFRDASARLWRLRGRFPSRSEPFSETNSIMDQTARAGQGAERSRCAHGLRPSHRARRRRSFRATLRRPHARAAAGRLSRRRENADLRQRGNRRACGLCRAPGARDRRTGAARGRARADPRAQSPQRRSAAERRRSRRVANAQRHARAARHRAARSSDLRQGRWSSLRGLRLL